MKRCVWVAGVVTLLAASMERCAAAGTKHTCLMAGLSRSSGRTKMLLLQAQSAQVVPALNTLLRTTGQHRLYRWLPHHVSVSAAGFCAAVSATWHLAGCRPCNLCSTSKPPVLSSMATRAHPLLSSPLQMMRPAALRRCQWSQSWSWTQPSSSRWA